MNIILWIAQSILAATLLIGAVMKLFMPIKKIASIWPWAGELSPAFVRFTGVLDLLGAIGLVLPYWLQIDPALTPITAIAVILLMTCASIFHIRRSEANIGINIFCAIIALFIVWGRL